MIRRCKMLLWFPKKYRDILMSKESKISTDFFIEIYPVSYRLSQERVYRYPDKIELFIDACMDKFLENRVDDVKEFRELRKCMGYFETARLFKDFLSKIHKFVKTKSVGLEIFAVKEVEQDRSRKNILKYVSYLNENLSAIDPNLISDIYIIDQLIKLKSSLDNLLEDVD